MLLVLVLFTEAEFGGLGFFGVLWSGSIGLLFLEVEKIAEHVAGVSCLAIGVVLYLQSGSDKALSLLLRSRILYHTARCAASPHQPAAQAL